MRYVAIALLAIVALAVLAACNAAALLNTITPSSSFERDKGIAYGDLPRQTLDVYRAVDPREGAPTVMFVHGGGWEDGDKKLYKFIGDAFAKDGFDVVVPNYRLHPDAVYPDTVADTALAAAWAVDTLGKPVVMIGHSAGGYNVLQAVFAPEISADAGLAVCDSVAGVVSLAGPTGAYELKSEPYVSVFPGRFLEDDAPLARAQAGFTEVPPILFVHGDKDTTVGPKNSTALGALLGPRAQVALYEGRGHVDVVRLLARRFEDDSSIKAAVVEFIEGLPETGFCEAPA